MHYGADYNPEQWPEELWPEDVARMREAGVTMVSLGIFAWSRIQPREGEFDFGWLDRVIDLLHEGGIAVDLATATASPPPWASAAYPELLPQDEDGATYWPGSRQQFAPSSPVYRRLAAELVTAIAERYATASGRGDVARQQRVRLPPEHGLLGCRARRVPALAGRSLRRRRRAQRRVGHELLVAALPVVRRGVPAAQGALQREPRPDARLPAVHERHAARVLPDGARHHPRRRGDAADHHELHGCVQAGELRRSGPSTSTSSATTPTPIRTTPSRSGPRRSSATSCGRSSPRCRGSSWSRRRTP